MEEPPKYKVDKRDPIILIRHGLSWYLFFILKKIILRYNYIS